MSEPTENVTWTLKPEQAQYIMNVLATRPYQEVYTLLAGLSLQSEGVIQQADDAPATEGAE